MDPNNIYFGKKKNNKQRRGGVVRKFHSVLRGNFCS